MSHRHEQSMLGPYCVDCRESLRPPYGYWDNGQPNAPEGWDEYTVRRFITQDVTFRARSPEHALSHSMNMIMVPYGGDGVINDQEIVRRKH